LTRAASDYEPNHLAMWVMIERDNCRVYNEPSKSHEVICAANWLPYGIIAKHFLSPGRSKNSLRARALMRSSHHFRSSSFTPRFVRLQTFGHRRNSRRLRRPRFFAGMALRRGLFFYREKRLATQPVQYEYAPHFRGNGNRRVWSFHNKSVGCDATS